MHLLRRASENPIRDPSPYDRRWIADKMFTFVLLEDMTTQATAEIYYLDGTELQPKSSGPWVVKNTLSDFGHLVTGNDGICYRDGDLFYAIHPEDPDGVSELVTFTLTSNLASGVGSTATATVGVSTSTAATPGSTITVYNTGGFRSYIGLTGLAILTGGQWWIVFVDQHCLQFYATLSSNTHNMSTSGNVPGSVASQITLTFSAAEALTPYPFSYLPAAGSLTVTNPQNFFGKSGDKVLVVHKRSTDTNEVIDLYPAFARSIYALFDENTPNGLTPTILCSPFGASPLGSVGEISGSSFNVKDVFYRAHNGRTNDRALIVRNEISNEWEVLECEHNSTVVLGSVVSTFSSSDTTFQLALDDGINFTGEMPASPITVQNTFGYALAEDDPVMARWDPINGQWIPVEAYPQAGKSIEYTIISLADATDADFTGLKVATVKVRVGPTELVDQEVEVYDHSGCIFDEVDMAGYTGWAIWGRSISLDTGKSCTPTPPLTPWHWSASNRCCEPNTGTYRNC